MKDIERQNEQPKILLTDATKLLDQAKSRLIVFEVQKYSELKIKLDHSRILELNIHPAKQS